MHVTNPSIVESVLYRNPIAPGTASQNATSEFVLESSSQFKFNVTPGMTVDHVTVMTLVSVYLTAMTKKNESKSVETSTEPPQDGESENSNYDLGNETYIFPKRWWGGLPIQPSETNRTLPHPTNMAIIIHTASPTQCMSLTDCSKYLQTVQSMHISDWGFVDVAYNFIIGGDGNIYEGLGWDLQNYIKNNSIAIAFCGNYIVHSLNDRQRTAALKLLDIGVKLGKLDKDYVLVAHNQVSPTLSPGRFLIEDIKSWPHYSARLFI